MLGARRLHQQDQSFFPERILRRILCHLPFYERHEVAVLVCKRWANVLSSEAEDEDNHCLWSNVVLDLNDYKSRQRRLSWAKVLKWISQRSEAISNFVVCNFQDPEHVHHDCPTGAFAGIAGRLWPSLIRLSFDNCDESIVRGTDFVAIAPFQKLRVLNIVDLRGPFHAAQLDNLGHCVRLEELRIIYAGSGTQQVQYGGFPERLTNLTNLTALELTAAGPNSMPSLPDGISKWKRLQELQMFRCGVEFIPSSISELHNSLQVLQIDGFPRYNGPPLLLPSTISTLTRLSALSFAGWNFQTVPEVVGRMPALLDLDLSMNPLRSISLRFPCWGHMRGLKLACCNLRALPDALCAMGELGSLDLSMNESLDTLPTGSYLDKLEWLDLSRCGFSRIPEVLIEAPCLQSLDMSYNDTMEMEPGGVDLLLQLPCLKELILKKSRIPPVALSGHNQLYSPAPWSDASMVQFMRFSRELVLRRGPAHNVSINITSTNPGWHPAINQAHAAEDAAMSDGSGGNDDPEGEDPEDPPAPGGGQVGPAPPAGYPAAFPPVDVAHVGPGPYVDGNVAGPDLGDDPPDAMQGVDLGEDDRSEQMEGIDPAEDMQGMDHDEDDPREQMDDPPELHAGAMEEEPSEAMHEAPPQGRQDELAASGGAGPLAPVPIPEEEAGGSYVESPAGGSPGHPGRTGGLADMEPAGGASVTVDLAPAPGGTRILRAMPWVVDGVPYSGQGETTAGSGHMDPPDHGAGLGIG
eukprot:jgi/Botrbrau1/262/Bobra.0022s0233.1